MSDIALLPASKPYDNTTPWSTVGYLTYKRTYSRVLDDGNTEEWVDTIQRVLDATNGQLNCNFTPEELSRLKYYLLKLKGNVAGRFLWQLGTKTVDKLGLASLQNCAAVVVDNPIKPFTWTMDMLMLGAGVGYSIQKEHVSKLTPVKKNFKRPTRQDDASADFIVSDTREGWVLLLERTLEAAFAKKKDSFTYSTQLIRGQGKPIKGFGGMSSGPEALCFGIDNISTILEKRAGRQLRPIDCLDIMNIIGQIVVSGNIRRSAQLAIGDPDDIEFLLAKRWDLGNIPPWRSMSNNSVACDDISELHEFFWDGYEGKGEPYGLINLELSRKIGRIGETEYPDPSVQVYNPCFDKNTIIKTDIGDIPIKDLVGKSVNIYSNGKLVSIDNFRITGYNRAMLKITLKTNNVIRVTPEHTMILDNDIRISAKELLVGMKLKSSNNLITSQYNFNEVISIQEDGIDDVVYCCTVPDTHSLALSIGIEIGQCAEQSLSNWESCCLSELFLPNIETYNEFIDIVTLLYRVNKHSLALKCHHKDTEKVVNTNMRMGIGVTGYLQATDKQKGWLDKGYKYLRDFDKQYSKDNNFPESIKLTTCKPSGSQSLLPGVTPGCHPGYAQYMIRRISVSSTHPIVDTCKDHGYPYEYRLNYDGSVDYSTTIVSFPYSYPEGTVLAKDMTAIDQLKTVKEIQKNWSDNAVSCTIYYRKEELSEIKKYLNKHFTDNYKTLSFLLHSDHGFLQAPYEEITKEEFDILTAKTKLITSISKAQDLGLDDDCATGACPVR